MAKKKRKSWKNKSNKEIFEYVRENFNGMPYNQLRRENQSVFGVILRRELLSKLLEEGVLTRTYPRYSKDELKSLMKQEYKGIKLTELTIDRGLHTQVRRRGLLKELISEGVIVKTNRDLKNMPDEELKHYVRSNYYGEALGELGQVDSSVYREINKRNLTDYLVDEGTIVRLRKK